MVAVTKIVETCGGCPSQWSGRTATGQYLYIRYRYGELRIELDGDVILQQSVGDDLDGGMDFADLVQHTGNILDFSDTNWVDQKEIGLPI